MIFFIILGMKAILINKEKQFIADIEIEAIGYYPRYIKCSMGIFEFNERTSKGVKYILV